MRRRRTWRWAATALVLALAGCSHFGTADQQGAAVPPTGAPAPWAPRSTALAPADAAAATTGPTTAAPEPAQARTGTTDVVRSPVRPAPGNVAAATSGDGLEVEVLAEGGPDYPSQPRFRVQVTLRNRSQQVRHHFLGQGNFAVLFDGSGAAVWASGECNPTLEVYEVYGGAAPLRPGEEVSAIVDYPQPSVPDDVGCDLPDGRYTLVGLFPVCPPEQVEETGNPGTYSCPEESVEMRSSAGLAVTFGQGPGGGG